MTDFIIKNGVTLLYLTGSIFFVAGSLLSLARAA